MRSFVRIASLVRPLSEVRSRSVCLSSLAVNLNIVFVGAVCLFVCCLCRMRDW